MWLRFKRVYACILVIACGCSTPASISNIPQKQESATSRLAPRAPNDVLYVSSLALGMVYAFTPDSVTPELTINDGVSKREPEALAVDPAGDLYVAGGNFATPSLSEILVFDRNSHDLLRTIHNGITVPDSEAFDTAGDLYVANRPIPSSQIGGPSATPPPPGSVAVFAARSDVPFRTITDGIDGPSGLAFDRKGDLYVANYPAAGNGYGGSIAVYSPGATTPAYSITNGIHRPGFLTLDREGNLFVPSTLPQGGSVNVYAPGATAPAYSITQGIGVPENVAIDTKGDLYVGNSDRYAKSFWVSVYAPGGTKPLRVIRSGVFGGMIAIDPSGNLYVAGQLKNVVAEFAEGGTTPFRTLAINSPWRLTFGPR